MVLVKAGRNLSIPHTPTPQLIGIAALGHKYIALLEHAVSSFAGWNANCFYDRQIRMTRLHICHTKIRILVECLARIVLTKRDARLNLAGAF